VLLGVPNALDPQNLGSTSSYLFAKPEKTASYLMERCPKMIWDSRQKVLDLSQKLPSEC
jgi:hypothetical protein